jgi:hypothetical protein
VGFNLGDQDAGAIATDTHSERAARRRAKREALRAGLTRWGFNFKKVDQAERQEADRLASEYREERGIEAARCDVLMEVLTASQVRDITETEKFRGWRVPAIRWRYFDADGKEIDDYIKLRFLKWGGRREPSHKSWASPGAHLYIPAPIYGDDLAKILADTGRAITICEGEAECIRLAIAKTVAFGIGGCWMFAGRKAGLFLVPELEKFNLKRLVELNLDADKRTKPDVRAAWFAGAKELTNRGAIVKSWVPPADGPKGPGDYIQALGLGAYLELPREEYAFTTELHKANGIWTMIDYPPAILLNAKGAMVKPGEIRDTVRDWRIIVTGRNGKPQTKLVLDEWMEWAGHARATGLAFEPGQPTMLPDGQYNLWPGWAAPPIEGDVSLWLRLMDHGFGNDTEARHWFEQFCAYQIQFPGTKLFTAPVLWSEGQGTAKSLTGEIFGTIFGPSFTTINPGQLKSSFNQFIYRRQFILANEITNRKNLRLDSDALKDVITRCLVEINIKNIKQFEVRDCVNWLFTSNHADGIFLDDYDRRFFIVHWAEKKIGDDFAEQLHAWKNGGAASVLRHYFGHYDLAGFKPRAAAPRTTGRAESIDANRSDLERFCFEVVATEAGEPATDKWPFGRGDLFTIELITDVFDPNGRTSTRATANALRKAGAVEIIKTVKVSGRARRLWAIRSGAKWQGIRETDAGHDALKAEFGRGNPGEVPEQARRRAKF